MSYFAASSSRHQELEMTYQEARRLVIYESCATEASDLNCMIVELRAGDDPGAVQVRRLLIALRVIFEKHRGDSQLDRELAYALHILAQEIIGQTMGPKSANWRKEFLEWERVDIQSAAEAVLQGEWPDTWLMFGADSKLTPNEAQR